MTRENMITQFEETLQVMRCEEELLVCIGRTRMEEKRFEKLQENVEDEEVFLEAEVLDSDTIRVRNLRTENVMEALIALHEERPTGKIGVKVPLRFPKLGGNVLRGGDGVEENLCRSSTVYPCFDVCENGYVYLPNVVCLRDGAGNFLKKEERFLVDVIIGYGNEEEGQDAKLLLFE